MLPRWTLFISLALLTAPANAQSEAFERPAAGFVFSLGSHSVRPLLGIPGATYIGEALLRNVESAWIAPGGKWAFVTTAAHSGFIRGLADGAPAELAGDGIIDAVNRVAWNLDGSFAVLYSTSTGRLQRARLTSDHVSLENPAELAPFGTLTGLSIDPSGRRIAFCIEGVGVYVMDGAQSPALVISLARPTAIAFSDTGRLYAADANTRRILEFGPDLSPTEFTVIEAVDGAQFEPVGLALSATGGHLVVADRGTNTLRIYETATRTLANTIELNLAPTQIERLSTGPTFLLNRANGTDWLLLLDATSIPRVYFVPSGEQEAQ